MDLQRAILTIIHASTEPLGWYGIAVRLGMKGVVLDDPLVVILHTLEQRGLIKHQFHPDHPHGIYSLTPAGLALLQQPGHGEVSATE